MDRRWPLGSRAVLDNSVAHRMNQTGHAAMLSQSPSGTLRRWLAPAVVTLLGAWLRFYHLADFYSSVDHDFPLAQAIRWLQLGQWPLLGQGTSVLVANPPGMSYLMAVPWLLFGSLWGATYFTIGLNVLAVPLTYQAGRLAGGQRTGLAAATLVAANPWANYFSRGTWVQGLLPFWTTLTCALLLLALFGRAQQRCRASKAGLLFGALAALTGLTQMYLLALLSIAPVALILLLNWRRVPKRGLVAGGAVLAIATAWFGWQLARDWPNQAPKVAEFFKTSQPAHFDWTALNHAARFVTGADYEAVFGNDGTPAWQWRRKLGQMVAPLLGVVLALGLLRAVWRIANRRPDAGLWLALLIWWAVPIAALSYSSHPVNIVYLVLSLPAGYVLAAPILAPLASRRLGPPALLGLCAYSFVLVAAGTAQVAAQPAAYSLDYLSVGAVLKVTAVAQAVAGEYHLDEFYTPLLSESLTAKVGQPLQAISWSPLPEVELFQVDRPSVYMRLEHGGRPPALRLGTTVAEVAYPGQALITFDLIRAYTRAELAALPQHRIGWRSEQGLTLVGYDVEPDNHSLWMYWTVDTLVDGREQWLYAPFVSVSDEQGRLMGRTGAPGLEGYFYRGGDVFLSHVMLPAMPAGEYHLDLGMYDGIHQLSLYLLPPGGARIDYYRGKLVIP
jgi:4-amino-4-deoxy-L-arabinose transferase-like glycosyltransferase